MNTSEQSLSRASSLVWCIAVCVAYVLVCTGIAKILGAVQINPPAPESVPANWWSVDVQVTRGAINDAIALTIFLALFSWRKFGFAELGFTRIGNYKGWLLGLALVALNLLSHPFVRNGGPYPLASYTLYAALMIGVPTALVEETVFRGFAIAVLKRGGFNGITQVLLSGILFGLAHIGYLASDWTVIVGTTVVGIAFGWVYVVSGRSLWPVIVGHAINDGVMLPYFFVNSVF